MRLTMISEGVQEDATVALLKSVIRGTEFEGKVYIAGGYVRDEMLGKQPKDIDLVVNVPPIPCDRCRGAGTSCPECGLAERQYRRVPGLDERYSEPIVTGCTICKGEGVQCPKCSNKLSLSGGIQFAEYVTKKLGIHSPSNPVTYPRFGTAMIHFQGVTHGGVDLSGMEVECVGPRAETYADPNSRNPEIEAGTLKQDVERRDFTANSLLKNLTTDEVEDLTGLGVQDLRAGMLRTPLDADIIFSDDPLRMLRAVRFAVKYGWQFAPGLEDAIKKNAHRLAIISKERVRDELEKMLVSPDPVRAFRVMLDTGLIEHVHPRLAEALRKAVGMTQNRFHTHDVYDHIMEVVSQSSPGVAERLAALLHDIGKPATRKPHEKNEGEYTFIHHEKESAAMATEILKDLKFPNDTISNVVAAVNAHMSMKDPHDASDRAIRRWVRRLLGSDGEAAAEKAAETLDLALDLLRADAMGHAHGQHDPGGVGYLRQRIADLKATEPDQLRQKLVSGHDLISTFGIKPGPHFKPMMDFIQDVVDDNPDVSKEEVLEMVREKFF